MAIRLSSRFWIACAATVVLCGGLGVAMGSFAVGPMASPSSGGATLNAAIADRSGGNGAAALPDTVYQGTDTGGMAEPVNCIGCGPTLAERRIMGDAAGTPVDPQGMDVTVQHFDLDGTRIPDSVQAMPPAVQDRGGVTAPIRE
jgi:hypothetical protein